MEIGSVQFCTLSEEEIRRISVCEIKSCDLYEKNVPKPGGLADLRLGTIDRHFKCHTCHGDIIKCPGHFGHIELYEPMYHISYMKTVLKVLSVICIHCGNPLCEKLNVKGRKRDVFKYYQEKCKNMKQCSHCASDVIKYVYGKDHKLYYVNEEGNKVILNAKDVHNIFSRIEPEAIGFDSKYSHPKNLLLTVMLVPPLHVRPSVMMEAVVKSQDDLTHKLIEIVKTNENLKKQTSDILKNEFLNLLQFHINTYIDNEIPGHLQATHRTGRTIKGISQRLKAKEGRIRGNLMGKRVDFSARTVITGEPNICLDELGVPEEIATTLTYPEKVTNFNKEYLQQLVNNGPNEVRGAKYVLNGELKKDLRFCKNIKVNIGDTVERHMKDGDVVVFNRQPTLHKMSMMGHKVRVMKGSTFRMNLSATPPYNADFDKLWGNSKWNFLNSVENRRTEKVEIS